MTKTKTTLAVIAAAACLFVIPLAAQSVLGFNADVAHAEKRDPGHAKNDKGKQDTGKG